MSAPGTRGSTDVVASAEVELSPRHPARGRLRAVRTAVLGAASLDLAGSAHVLGGGRLPSLAVLVVLGLLVGLAAVVVTARRCRFGLLLGLLALEQVALHLALDAATAGTTCATVGAGHHSVGTGMASCVSGGVTSGAMAMPSWGMWLAHGVAVLATAWLLARGEAWLWRATDQLVSAATAAPAAVPAVPGGADPTTPDRPLVAHDDHRPAAPRGPPSTGRP